MSIKSRRSVIFANSSSFSVLFDNSLETKSCTLFIAGVIVFAASVDVVAIKLVISFCVCCVDAALGKLFSLSMRL